ncbi:MAG: flagellar hook-associated protein FlgK, partial [Desulfovibrio sp.]|nr:flagellar hook-associated protein FlgK [Desulfovibrio sp.]
VFWISPTAGPQNISVQIFPDGTDNSLRITGGTLAGYLETRDYKIGEYRSRLDAFAKTLAWEVNRLHSQGAGLEPFSSMYGAYSVGNTNVPLGSPEARFTWSDKLQAGNMTFAVYDSQGNAIELDSQGNAIELDGDGLKVFSNLPPNGNFDPTVHSLQDVMNAINDKGNETSQYMRADIVHGKLQITAMLNPKDKDKDNNPLPYSFAITDDTTGLAAALGINTFFTGDSAADIGVRGELSINLNQINAGRLDGQGQINEGDNQTAREIAALAGKGVDIKTAWNHKTRQTIGDYYATLVTRAGADTQSCKFTAGAETAMAQELYVRQEEISGVNLDEEMSSLIKFQASYKAAAKLITTADEMLQTLLSLK